MSPSLKPIEEQVLVITGASSGIGLATAALAVDRGARVVLTARSGATLDRVVDGIEQEGGEAMAVVADVGDRAQLRNVAARAVERFGRIDTWVNNAGVSIYGRLEEVDEEEARRLFDTNFWGVVHGSLVALDHLRDGGGALINVGSEVSEAIVPLQGMYSASKHAVKGFTDALRVELGELDDAPVAITLVEPTATDTPFPQHARNYMDREPKLPTPMIDPYDVAEAILEAAVGDAGSYRRVGMMARLNTAAARTVPSLADKLEAMQADRQQYDEPPRAPEGTLFRPSESGRTHGTGGAG